MHAVPVRLARSAVDLAEQACGARGAAAAKWIEQAIRLRHGSEELPLSEGYMDQLRRLAGR
jgi:hypothetical protein